MQDHNAVMIGSSGDQLHRVILLLKRSTRHFWKAALVCLVGTALAVGLALMKKRVYRSEAVILYREAIDPAAVSNAAAGPKATTRDIGARLQELLMARPRLKRIIKKYKLYPRAVHSLGYVEAVDKMRKNIDFKIGQGDTFHIAFRASKPELAQAITSELANSLIAQDTYLRQEQAEATQRFLSKETQLLQRNLDLRQRKLAKFLSDNPEFAQDQQAHSAGASVRALRERRRQHARGVDALSVMKRQAERLELQLKNPSAAAPKAPADPKLVMAKERAGQELADARSNLSRARARYTEKHPDVVAGKSRVQRAVEALKRVTAAVRASRRLRPARKVSDADREALKGRLAALQRQIVSLKRTRRRAGSQTAKAKVANKATNRIVALETEWQRLNREVRQARDAYVKLEERLFRARLAASSESVTEGAQMRIIDPAYEPTRPAGVGRSIIVAAGGLVSGFLGALLMLGLAWVDDRIYDAVDIERAKLTDVLVEVPKAPRRGRARINSKSFDV